MKPSLSRFTYSASQSARVAWYLAHYAAAFEGQRRVMPAVKTAHPLPDRATIRRALSALFEQDWRNIEAGLYALPHDLLPDPRSLARRSRAFLADVPRVARRRAAAGVTEVRAQGREARYPAYYLQNFHFQTDGYLSTESARLYDFQVETLFSGAGDAMRRQALVPMAAALRGRDQRACALLDVACGTGRFLSFVKDTYPRLCVTGLDLSGAYLSEARRLLAPWRGVDLVQANAETLPLPDRSQDIVTCIFLFHELPPKIRHDVAREMVRVLKPGGLIVVVDSLQTGDVPALDGLLDAFPEGFHEPFYRSYLTMDLAGLFAAAGCCYRGMTPAYLAKTLVFEGPAA